MSDEVSCRMLRVFFRALARKGLPAETLSRGSRYSLAHLKNNSARLDWEEYCIILGNLGRVFTDDELTDIGRDTFADPIFRYVGVVARILFNATEFYRWVFEGTGKGIGKTGFSCVEPRYEELAPLHLRLTMTVPVGFKPAREYFLVCRGNFIEMPRILGLPPSTVSMSPIPQGAEYLVKVPAGGGWWRRFRRGVALPLTIKATAQELKSAHEDLRQRYDELELARAELAAKNAQLQAINDTLEQKVAQRTAELERSLERLTEVDRQKTEFFANASHELRTPLTLMLAPLELLVASKELSPDAKAELGAIARSGYRLLKLVNDLLELSMIEAGKMSLAIGSVELASLLTEALRPWRPALRARQITLLSSLEPALSLAGDAERLEQVALNLISNAIKFTPDRGTIEVKAGRDGEGLFFSVQNSGDGLSPDELAALFGRFNQSTRSRTRRFGSSGLGLPVARHLVELHGGTIGAEALEGHWVRFTVRLPPGRLDPATASAAIRPSASELLQYQAASIRENDSAGSPLALAEADGPELPTLLLAEDNLALRAFIGKNLASSFRVIEAGDGAQALRLARQHQPDVVLADLMMPELDGLELCAGLKADPESANIPFVLLTARADLDTRLTGFAKGADDYLLKPFHLEELRARLQAQLRLRTLAVQVAQTEKLAALGMVVAGVAHEIRNPLNGIINSLAPLKELMPGASPELIELIDLAIESSKRVEYISDQLLKQGRAGEGARGDVDLGENVRLALRLLSHTIGAGVQLAFERTSESVNVIGEAGALQQVWVNLIDNAIKAASPSGRVAVRLARTNGHATVEVSDDGRGIEPRVLKRIFDPFFSTREIGVGTGLGLAIVREIVEKHGGEISVESRPGHGARFTVKLPHATPIEGGKDARH